MHPVNIIVHGRGKMGRMVLECTRQSSDTHVIALLGRNDEILSDMFHSAAVAVDFSASDATTLLVNPCVKHHKPLVIGTTGHTDEQRVVIENAATKIPIVKATNFSIGTNVLFALVRHATHLLGPDFDPEITEAHHSEKKDAPSGTAKTLLGILQEVRSGQHQEMFPVYGREGMVCARSADEIGIHSLRGGDVVGEHTVLFLGGGERVELTHRASSRTIFALGALRAAKWVVGKSPGLYSMQDVLGLR